MKVVDDLRAAGYEVIVKGGKVVCRWIREDPPAPQRLVPLLEELRRRKGPAIEYLRSMPGNCESCPAAGHWDGCGRRGMPPGRYCFHSAYFEGKCDRPAPVDGARSDCPRKKEVRR
jgi:hypothetical protein